MTNVFIFYFFFCTVDIVERILFNLKNELVIPANSCAFTNRCLPSLPDFYCYTLLKPPPATPNPAHTPPKHSLVLLHSCVRTQVPWPCKYIYRFFFKPTTTPFFIFK